MAKSGYEIRLRALEIAKDLATDAFYQAKECKTQAWESARDHARDQEPKQAPPPYPTDIPAFPTTADIIAKAKELNTFICEKDSPPESQPQGN